MRIFFLALKRVYIYIYIYTHDSWKPIHDFHDLAWSLIFYRTDRRFPPFQRAAQLWLNRSLPLGTEKKIELLLFKLLVQRFVFFVHRKNTINCFTRFFFHSCSHMFRYVPVSFHFSSKDGLQLKVLGRGHAAAAAEVQSQCLLPPEKQGGENTKKMEKRKLLCSTVGAYEKLTLIISFVILCIFRSSDPLSYT